uniref:Major facilitator superfamily (MFS) profile domain-containing protein n=1 Tax=Quercus lobata TaxID=97700 RepID=A0A7N2L4U3_QUELO
MQSYLNPVLEDSKECYLLYDRIAESSFIFGYHKGLVLLLELGLFFLCFSLSECYSSVKQLIEISTFALFCLVPDLFIVVNEPLESISVDLHFSGNTLAEGLVVSTCLGGAVVGALLSGWIADGVG